MNDDLFNEAVRQIKLRLRAENGQEPDAGQVLAVLFQAQITALTSYVCGDDQARVQEFWNHTLAVIMSGSKEAKVFS